ncbi:GTP 3',8-cyclase MoaA [Uliginosibacterium sp. H1]|uniref:GTP 3',8-cyclase MoaA n=1 Tax=Uliginosibacterium sp. H1 TaxID=3114757 RepID=UPI002E18534E|nr:GTP 3',8-cyclase MoaA [Uliginosibacterium sp. H1]
MTSHPTHLHPVSLDRLRTAPAHAGEAPPDRLGRAMRDLRISVTDRCNFRCSYCMPRDQFGRDHAFLPREALLRFEEITQIARVFAGLGVRKIRLTGGEPLLRKNLPDLVAMLAEIPDVELTLTTNGALLARHARALREAGLRRVTVSLDALDDAVFRQMNDMDFPVADVLAGIDAAAAEGLGPVKVNAVIRRGLNDGQILPLVRHFRNSGHILRFIEYMDVGSTNGWRLDDVLPAQAILDHIHAVHPLQALEPGYGGEVAERWRYADGAGEIGVIASVTRAFCRDCTRMRLSPEGRLFTCLFASQGYDLREHLRAGDSPAQLAGRIAAIWAARSDRYSELRSEATPGTRRIEMSYIGG